jgi:hypothetical protein
MSRKTYGFQSFKKAEDYKIEDTPEMFVPLRKRTEPHFHFNELGIGVRCYHEAKNLLTDWRFWVGLTMGFPAEHLLWEKVWPFYLLTSWVGL